MKQPMLMALYRSVIPNPGDNAGKVVPMGNVTGTKVEKEIGVSGGQLTSNDGKMTITIPAGHVVTPSQGQVGVADISGAFRLKYE